MHPDYDVIDKLGGGTAVARKLAKLLGRAVDREVVYKWRTNGIGWRYRAAVARLAESEGVALPEGFLVARSA